MSSYYVAACAVIAVHALFILWVIFGAAVTRRHPLLRLLHIASLLWGIWIEVGPWPCPLTLVENWLELRAGVNSYQGSFLLHYLDSIVYPQEEQLDTSASWGARAVLKGIPLLPDAALRLAGSVLYKHMG